MERTGSEYNNGSTGSSTSVLSMQGGGGADSYAANSSIQMRAFHVYAKPHLAEAVRLAVDNSHRKPELSHPDSTNLCHVAIADLGCSYGDNALVYAKFIVHAFTQGFLGRRLTNHHHHHHHTNNYTVSDHQLSLHHPAAVIKDVNPDHVNGVRNVIDDRVMMEIQYFFSDLPSNDFNHLFRSLAAASDGNALSRSSSSITDDDDDDQLLNTTKVYPAGVPGSFYDRLFPSRSLNFVICALALHWLSQVPPVVLDKSSPSWNGGHVWGWGNKQRPQVAQAFARQSKADLIRFFRCRAEEMATNAILFLLTLVRDEDHDYLNINNYTGWGFVEDTWNEMVNEGIISCEEMDTFNVPEYVISRRELELALKEVPELKILKLEVMEDLAHPYCSLLKDPQAYGKTWAKFVESISKPMIQAHIGLKRTTLFFERLERVTSEKAHLMETYARNYLIVICQRC